MYGTSDKYPDGVTISYDSSPVWWWLLWTGLLGKGLPDLEARGGGRRAKGGCKIVTGLGSLVHS